MKKFSSKKMTALLLSTIMIFSLNACESKPTSNVTPSTTQEATEDPDKNPVHTQETSASPEASKHTSPNQNDIEAGLGDLVLFYNDKWVYDAEQSADASLAFTRGDALIGVVCSKETTYQTPKDMAQKSLDMVKQQYSDVKLLQDITEITVNGETWVECSYEIGSGDEKQIHLQRCYGKNYYGYTVTYTGLADDFEAYKSNAISILDTCMMSVPDNTAGEEAAKKELVGELDAGDKGYLELKDDGTYYWYSSSDKAMDNVHYGTYICDNKIPSINIGEGQNGYLLVLLPEKYFVSGEETEMGVYQINFAISKTSTNDADYQGINLANYGIYDFVRVK